MHDRLTCAAWVAVRCRCYRAKQCEVLAQLRAYTDVGLDELMLHWTVADDIEGLRLLAEYVLPHFGA